MTAVWLLLAAPFIGSFLGVLVRRLPAGKDWMRARSSCETCSHPLGPADLVPLASFLVLRGRCRHCGAPISRFHPAIELAALAVCVSAVAVGGSADALAAECVLGWGLLALAWIDAETFYLPDLLTLPLLLAGLGDALWRAPELLAPRAAGALAGWFGLLALAALYRRLRGREGIGGGDAKLLGVGGAWLGWQALPWVLLLAALLGLGWAGLQAARGRRLDAATALPFGPPLALAIWLLLLQAALTGRLEGI
jgi:leader peptidase (prepilin peptidase)/N-methyltransferase